MKQSAPSLSHTEHRHLLWYQQLLRIRMVEEAIADRYSEQEMRCPVHLSIGQEAVAVGVCAALAEKDEILSTHRAHAHYLAKGGNLRRMLAEIHGRETGCCRGRGGSMHLMDLAVGFMGSTPIVGGSLPVAVGYAFARKLQDDARVTVVFFGEGATEEGVFSECLNFAALHQLGIVFVCENNLYSVYSPLAPRQAHPNQRSAQAKAMGIEVESADGNQVDAVAAVAERAVERARSGQGPSYLEFATYRSREHCGPNLDNTLGYRTVEEAAEWEARCPLRFWEERLLQQGLLCAQQRGHWYDEIDNEISDAFDYALNSPWPELSSLTQGLFATEVCE
ncbi:MAG: thiamine pyrophosphate-dependent dehydrogenase E1 component subunit alpha [Chlamydiia bacterium]|nr:thiamine pyrophosphate-dependent dehydrogenase E1 component subunit alpha [Chlamydiia bacterium]